MDFLSTSHRNHNVASGHAHTADEHGIVANVPAQHAVAMLGQGCVPLPPVGWIDPRQTQAPAAE